MLAKIAMFATNLFHIYAKLSSYSTWIPRHVLFLTNGKSMAPRALVCERKLERGGTFRCWNIKEEENMSSKCYERQFRNVERNLSYAMRNKREDNVPDDGHIIMDTDHFSLHGIWGQIWFHASCLLNCEAQNFLNWKLFQLVGLLFFFPKLGKEIRKQENSGHTIFIFW